MAKKKKSFDVQGISDAALLVALISVLRCNRIDEPSKTVFAIAAIVIGVIGIISRLSKTDYARDSRGSGFVALVIMVAVCVLALSMAIVINFARR